MEVWQSPVYCNSLENCRFRKGSVSSNLTASTKTYSGAGNWQTGSVENAVTQEV